MLERESVCWLCLVGGMLVLCCSAWVLYVVCCVMLGMLAGVCCGMWYVECVVCCGMLLCSYVVVIMWYINYNKLPQLSIFS